MVWPGATVDQVHRQFELRATDCSVQRKNIASDRVWGDYCGNTDNILPFQIEKMDLMMKLAPGFDDEGGPPAPPVNPSLYQCRLYLKFYYENFTLP